MDNTKRVLYLIYGNNALMIIHNGCSLYVEA